MRCPCVFMFLISMVVIFVACSHTQSRTARETPGIIFRGADGRTITMEDVRGLTGKYQYEIIGNRDIPAEARSLHQQARQVGGKGDYKRSLALLDRASALAPEWPYPLYDKAYTLLLMKDYDGAREYYRKTMKLSPRGFFTAITALDTLEKEQKGALPTGTYLAYLSLEWMENQGEKIRAARQLVNRMPQFAAGWKELAALVDDEGERLAALEKGLMAAPDAETKGMLQINRALILHRQGNHDTAVRILGELALDHDSPLDIEHIAKASLATMVQK
jgi:tetratricopeptide (TPR) repeat protein